MHDWLSWQTDPRQSNIVQALQAAPHRVADRVWTMLLCTSEMQSCQLYMVMFLRWVTVRMQRKFKWSSILSHTCLNWSQQLPQRLTAFASEKKPFGCGVCLQGLASGPQCQIKLKILVGKAVRKTLSFKVRLDHLYFYITSLQSWAYHTQPRCIGKYWCVMMTILVARWLEITWLINQTESCPAD